MNLVESQTWHLDILDPSGTDITHSNLCSTFSRTLMDNGTPVAAGGVTPIAPGVGEGWMMITDEAAQKPMALHRVVKRSLDEAANSGDWHRLQCVVHSRFGTGVRWANILGFECEGLLRQYIDRVDYFRFARLL